MTQKMAIVLAAVLTAFLLVFGGAIAARVSQADAAPKQAPAAPAPTAEPPTADVMAQAQALIQQRDAEYRQLIDQANQRLQAVYQQQQAIAQAAQAAQAAQVAQAASAAPTAPSSAPAAQPAAPTFTVSPDTAASIALQAANGATLIRAPELVRFEGQVAYEVGFTRGAVYVDANSGQVLYNGTQGGQGGGGKASAPASQPSTGGDDHEQSHESESHDD